MSKHMQTRVVDGEEVEVIDLEGVIKAASLAPDKQRAVSFLEWLCSDVLPQLNGGTRDFFRLKREQAMVKKAIKALKADLGK